MCYRRGETIMKKTGKLFLCIAAILLVLPGCSGKKEEDMKYLSDFDPEKYVTLGEYKGIEITIAPPSVSDEQVDEMINTLLNASKTREEITDRDDVREGDIANIDYEGKKDGVAFDGGTAQGYDLVIGSGTFIPGFEDGVIGMKVGETKDLPLTFPENYSNADLAGADVIFTVTVNAIKEEITPELNDEFVAALGNDASDSSGSAYYGKYKDLKTVDELREAIRADLMKDAQAEYENNRNVLIQNKVEEGCTFKTAPSGFVDRITATMTERITEMADSYGMDPGTIAAYYYGFSAETWQADIRSFCEGTLANQYIMMGAIAKREGIEVTDADIDADIQEILDGYENPPYTLEEYKAQMEDLESYREYLIVDRVMNDVLVKNAVIHEN